MPIITILPSAAKRETREGNVSFNSLVSSDTPRGPNAAYGTIFLIKLPGKWESPRARVTQFHPVSLYRFLPRLLVYEAIFPGPPRGASNFVADTRRRASRGVLHQSGGFVGDAVRRGLPGESFGAQRLCAVRAIAGRTIAGRSGTRIRDCRWGSGRRSAV